MITYAENLAILQQQGKTDALDLQTRAPDLTGTEIYAEDARLPEFDAAVRVKNMLDRVAGFVCKSRAGRAVKLIQPYDSTVYTDQPEELPAQWGFYWSQDPAKALPFIALSTSPYMTGDCCTHDGQTWRSGQDNNVWAPGTPGVKWEAVGVA